MTKETVTLSNRELDRVSIILNIVDKRLRQSQGAQQLGLSVRQVGRLVERYREAGPPALRQGQSPLDLNSGIIQMRQEIIQTTLPRIVRISPWRIPAAIKITPATRKPSSPSIWQCFSGINGFPGQGPGEETGLPGQREVVGLKSCPGTRLWFSSG